MERTVELGLLLAYYGAFLTERQRQMLQWQVDEDYSLTEIAEQAGISRQGVHDALRRAEQQLRAMEAQLGLLRRAQETGAGLQALCTRLQAAHLPEDERAQLLQIVYGLQKLWEESDGV